jgi:hypothetical protein
VIECSPLSPALMQFNQLRAIHLLPEPHASPELDRILGPTKNIEGSSLKDPLQNLNHPPPSALIGLLHELFTRHELTKIENLSTALLTSIYSSMLQYDRAISQSLISFHRSNTFHNNIFSRALPKLEPTATVIGGYNS